MTHSSILLLHGALGSAKDLEALSKALKEEGFAVYCLNFSGHSNKAFQTRYDIEQLSLEVEEFILQNNLMHVSIFGYSMGGFVALTLSVTGNVSLNKIITLGTKFNWTQETAAKERKNLQPEIIHEKIPNFAKSLLEKHGASWKELALKTADLMQDIADKNYLNDESLKKINTPILIGLADNDQMVTLAESEHVSKTLANAELLILPNSKHSIESIDVKRLANLIKTFILKS